MWDERKTTIALNLDTLPIGVCIIRSNFSISMWNKTLENWTGISLEDAIDKSLGQVVPRFKDPLVIDRMNLAFGGGGPVIFSSLFHSRIFPIMSEFQNEGRFQRITISPFKLPDGELRMMVAVEDVTAITEQVFLYRDIKNQIKIELEEKKKTAKALSIAIDKLNTLASITRHDLNNILTAFFGYITLISHEKPSGEIPMYLNKMEQAAGVMKNQIQFAKDYQEMGYSEVSWYNIGNIVRNNKIGPIFSNMDIICETGSLEILADPLLEKAIYNLFENALRHGECTSVISVRNIEIDDKMIIIVEDNGKGVPVKNKKKIFDRGFGSNTGLGLFLVREILGITEMEIEETGVEGNGARFEILVPAGHFRFRE